MKKTGGVTMWYEYGTLRRTNMVTDVEQDPQVFETLQYADGPPHTGTVTPNTAQARQKTPMIKNSLLGRVIAEQAMADEQYRQEQMAIQREILDAEKQAALLDEEAKRARKSYEHEYWQQKIRNETEKHQLEMQMLRERHQAEMARIQRRTNFHY